MIIISACAWFSVNPGRTRPIIDRLPLHQYAVEFEGSRLIGTQICVVEDGKPNAGGIDRKSTRLNSSHLVISHAVFCLKKKAEYRATKAAAALNLHACATLGRALPVCRAARSAPPSAPSARRACRVWFFFNDTPTTEIYTLSLHDALPF